MSSSNSESSSSFQENYGVHPLSYIVKEELDYKAGWVIASVLFDIRTTDQDNLRKFGPGLVDFGGTYGTNFIPQDIRPIVDELRVKKSFKGTTLALAAEDAKLWQSTIVEKATAAIWAAREKAATIVSSVESAVPV